MSKDKNSKKIRYVKIRDEDYMTPAISRSEKAAAKASLSHKLTPLQKIGKVFSAAGTAILCMVLILIITICIVATALTVYVMQFAESSFDVDLTNVELSYSSFIYATDKDGQDVLIKQISSNENRVWVDIDDIPQHVIDAVISVEDERFFEHDGVDWQRILSVVYQAVFNSGTAGGSTITQQLVRDITEDNEITIGRKLREIFRALSLENKYTKFDILESYLNRIGFGGTAYGIGSAAYYYFDKDVSELTIAEAAILAGVIRSPTGYNPYLNLENSKVRQLYALSHMYEQGYITTQEYEDACVEKVRFRAPVSGDFYGYVDERSEPVEEDEDLYYENVPWEEILGESTALAYQSGVDYEVTQNWYVDAALNQVIADLAELFDISVEAAREKLGSGGYSVYLNMDMEMQEKVEAKFTDPYTCLTSYDATLPADSKNLLQGAFVLMDYRGNVLAVAGGIGEKPGNNCFNRASQAVSAIGSTIKPLDNYSLAIDMDLITYSTMQKDSSGRIPADYAGEGMFDATSGYDPETDTVRWPHNYRDNTFGTGNYYPTWYAVQKSMNTIAARTIQKVGLENAFNQLVNKLGFTHLDSVSDIAYSPLATGAFTNGATLVELTAAYQIMGNGGMYYKPYFYSRVIDSTGKTVLEQDTTGKRAISEDSAWITNRMMLKVVEDPYGSGINAKFDNIEVVGKTGTSNTVSNLLFAGLTPKYLGVVRLAYDDNHEIRESNYKPLARIWHDVMAEVLDLDTEQSFTPDSSTLTFNYCTETGLLATSKCPQSSVGYYRASNIPPSCDSKHDGTYWAEHDEIELPLYE